MYFISGRSAMVGRHVVEQVVQEDLRRHLPHAGCLVAETSPANLASLTSFIRLMPKNCEPDGFFAIAST